MATRDVATPTGAVGADETCPLSEEEPGRLDANWRAANYLSAGQMYRLDDRLLREPLRLEQVNPGC